MKTSKKTAQSNDGTWFPTQRSVKDLSEMKKIKPLGETT
jgi:hypothetical protein